MSNQIQLKKPNWQYWTQIPKAPIWKVVLLSLDIESRNIFDLQMFELDFLIKKDSANPILNLIRERMDIVNANIGETLNIGKTQPTPENTVVKISLIAEWIFSRKWETPEGFNRLGTDEFQIIDKPIVRLSNYSTPWLDLINAATKEFFNPRRNPDAKRDEVIEWLKQQAIKSGLPDSGNIASAIFTIIKPENHDPKKKRVEPLD